MNEQSDNPMQDFNVLNFEVHAIYGAHFEVPSDEKGQKEWSAWFDARRRSSHPFPPIREGWTPIYRDHCSTVTLKISNPPWCSEIDVQHPIFFRHGEHGATALPSLKMKLSRWLTIRKDGMASITIRLEADKRETQYVLADLLAPLLLAPRIIEGIKLQPKDQKVKSREELATTTPDALYKTTADAALDSHDALIDGIATPDKSPLFNLFLGALKDIVSVAPHLIWHEYRATSNGRDQTKKTGGDCESEPELLSWVGDHQIPYFVVLATLPREIYNSAFLEEGAEFQQKKLDVRRKYTRHLAAIMQRWLSPHNAKFVSIDFLDSLKLLRNGAFVNKYTNSLSFVTYTSTGAVCLRPEPNNGHGHGELDPQEATYGSILRCVELSRLRWHHALRLNHLLDGLAEQVILHEGTRGFEDYLADLFSIRAEAALHFMDPLTYQWDAAVGSDIASFLHGDVIEKIENECIQKLEVVKELIHEKLDVLRARAMRRGLKRTQD